MHKYVSLQIKNLCYLHVICLDAYIHINMHTNVPSCKQKCTLDFTFRVFCMKVRYMHTYIHAFAVLPRVAMYTHCTICVFIVVFPEPKFLGACTSECTYSIHCINSTVSALTVYNVSQLNGECTASAHCMYTYR